MSVVMDTQTPDRNWRSSDNRNMPGVGQVAETARTQTCTEMKTPTQSAVVVLINYQNQHTISSVIILIDIKMLILFPVVKFITLQLNS